MPVVDRVRQVLQLVFAVDEKLAKLSLGKLQKQQFCCSPGCFGGNFSRANVQHANLVFGLLILPFVKYSETFYGQPSARAGKEGLVVKPKP